MAAAIRCCSASGASVADTVSGDQVADGLLPVELLAAAAAAGDMRLDERGVGRVELTVEQAAEEDHLIGTGGHQVALPEDSSLDSLSDSLGGSRTSVRIARPRDSRDMTVPIATPATSAISA